LADLSGQRKEPLPVLKDRKFVPIDRDNFNDVLAKAAPRLAMKVKNRLSGGEDESKLAVELNFKHIDDFEPTNVARQVEPLKELLDMRRQLTEMLGKMEGNDKLEQLLADVLGNTEQAEALRKQLEAETAKPEEGK
jgi:type VI secretion system protein ImpB